MVLMKEKQIVVAQPVSQDTDLNEINRITEFNIKYKAEEILANQSIIDINKKLEEEKAKNKSNLRLI